ncbi:MAG TPA: histidine--tRNA ligase [Gammaproteobacteria bacterium]|nr:histidine--tRNA ligase [Gammaproteobacteria bacterium]
MSKKLQAVRGMNDVLPEQIGYWQQLEKSAAQLFLTYGFGEIRLPLVESTELFSRSIGVATDIVEKEMYTFADRNGDSLTLRPEGTASVVRAGVERGLLYNQVRKLWYSGPMFRHERPQKGRYRQFHQIGAECFGLPGPAIDAELILLTAQLWQMLGISGLQLQINSLGDSESRQRYRQSLVTYLQGFRDQLDEDSQRRLQSNPLRILDSKNPDTQKLLQGAPSLLDSLDNESRDHFDQLKALLDSQGLEYEVNDRLVRGLDYYNRTVFEWITHDLGAQGTVCAGGRYDGLVEQLGGKATPAVGFALGEERLVELLAQRGNPNQPRRIQFIYFDQPAVATILGLAQNCRLKLPHDIVEIDYQGGNPGKKLARADKAGADIAVIVGTQELATKQVSIKFLRDQHNHQQETIDQTDLVEFLATAADRSTAP